MYAGLNVVSLIHCIPDFDSTSGLNNTLFSDAF